MKTAMAIADCPGSVGEYYARIYGKRMRRNMMISKRLIIEAAIIGLLLVLVLEARELIRVENDNRETLGEVRTMVTSMFTQGRVGMEVK